MESSTRVWRPDWPCPAVGILHQQRHGRGDPTFRVDDHRRVWWGVRTPEGAATLSVHTRPDLAEVHAEAWGSGAAWVLERVPALLGADDDWSGFEARHPVLEQARRLHPHARQGRSGLVMEALVSAVIEQKVTGQEAFAGYRRLVQRYGERAPGPRADLMVQPTPEEIRQIPSWAWLQMHVDPQRSRTVVTACRVADALQRTVDDDHETADRKLRTVPGIGVWTSAEIRRKAHGDPDAVSFGDYHVAKDVGWALTGTPFTDEEMAAYLEPWRPHRGRVPTLIALAGLRRPRHGPRMAPRTHLPVR